MENPDYRFARKGADIEARVLVNGLLLGGRLETGEHIKPDFLSWRELLTLANARRHELGIGPVRLR